MKIAFFHNLPSGGAKRTLFLHIKGLKSQHTIDLYQILSTDENFLDPSIFCNQVYNFPLKFPKQFFIYLYYLYIKLPILYFKISKLIEKNNYDCIFVHPCLYTQAPYLLIFLKTRNIYICHEPKREFYENTNSNINPLKSIIVNILRYPIKFIDFFCARKANLIISNSIYSKNKIDNIYHVCSTVINPPYDSDIFHILKIQKNDQIISVGALSWFKGFDFIILALSLIPLQQRPKFLIIGNNGNEKEHLLNLGLKMKVNLIIETMVDDERLCEAYNQSKLFVYAPINEPFGIAPIESLACNTPVLYVSEGGPKESLGNYGIESKRDPELFSKKIIEILNGDHKKNIDKSASYVYDKYSYKNVAQQLNKIISSSCNQNH